ncbi:hypothetical protein [Agromyces cerinus]|uniref:DUF3137 domain-containing protein n=1 Tax=Agromyces cerinus subsp. cerinus TaxID=232089 RepID=A0A1N6E7Y8_9MICO|nr:hypothetical protein [Agromyces cerinus]SIN79122.1 hypothetical protein SAMN05443544_1193 [Agromyces cerinus subsp. cerinus]
MVERGTASTATRLDTTALEERIDRAALTAFRNRLPPSIRPNVAAIFWPTGLLLVAALVLLVFWTSLLGDDLLSPSDPGEGFAAWFLLLPYLGFVAVSAVLVVRALVRRTGRRQYRLHRFAAANGMTYAPVQPGPALPGMIFTPSGTALASDVLARGGRHPVSIANHRSTTGEGKSRERHRWGYVAVRLPVSLPHIVLDAKGNNALGRRNLPVEFARSQRLRLEGDFDQYFELYCPDGYETDALSLFTPEVMAGFIDSVAELDVEIVDDHLFLYSRKDLSTLDPATWRWLFSVVDALIEQVVRWERWRDERLGATHVTQAIGEAPVIHRPPPGVAKQGRRLTPRVEWLWIVAGLLVFLIGVASIIEDIVT